MFAHRELFHLLSLEQRRPHSFPPPGKCGMSSLIWVADPSEDASEASADLLQAGKTLPLPKRNTSSCYQIFTPKFQPCERMRMQSFRTSDPRCIPLRCQQRDADRTSLPVPSKIRTDSFVPKIRRGKTLYRVRGSLRVALRLSSSATQRGYRPLFQYGSMRRRISLQRRSHLHATTLSLACVGGGTHLRACGDTSELIGRSLRSQTIIQCFIDAQSKLRVQSNAEVHEHRRFMVLVVLPLHSRAVVLQKDLAIVKNTIGTLMVATDFMGSRRARSERRRALETKNNLCRFEVCSVTGALRELGRPRRC